MITHPANSRGVADHGWLKSYHTFSFANYYDPSRMGFGALRVINDDAVAPAMGFGTHPHRDMEIISIPLEGSLKHQDSEGNSYEIRKGEIQVMSAGTGISHSEYNASDKEAAKFLQIWVLPKKLGIKPHYEQRAFSYPANTLELTVSPDGRENSLAINQDAFFSIGRYEKGRTFSYQKNVDSNGVYAFIIKGELSFEGETFKARDGIGVSEGGPLSFTAQEDLEILLMEVPL